MFTNINSGKPDHRRTPFHCADTRVRHTPDNTRYRTFYPPTGNSFVLPGSPALRSEAEGTRSNGAYSDTWYRHPVDIARRPHTSGCQERTSGLKSNWPLPVVDVGRWSVEPDLRGNTIEFQKVQRSRWSPPGSVWVTSSRR